MHVDSAARELCCKIVYCGPSMAGKTTNLERVYLNAPPDRRGKLSSIATEGERTLFFDYMPLDLGFIQGLRVRLAVYTVPGQALYAATRRTVLQGVDGVVFVADSEPERLDESVSALAELERILPQVRGRPLRELPLVFQWNKRDLPSALAEDQLSARLNPWERPCVAAVAKEGQGVLETLRLISQATLKDCRRQLGLGPDSSSAARPLRRARTSRRLRKLRAARVAELHRVGPKARVGGAPAEGARVALEGSGRSSEAPTLPYGRRRHPGPRPVRTPVPPQTLARPPRDPGAQGPPAPEQPRKPTSAKLSKPEQPEKRQKPASAKLSKPEQPEGREKPASAKLSKPTSEKLRKLIAERETVIPTEGAPPAAKRIPPTNSSGVHAFDLTESFEVQIPPSEAAPIAELRESAIEKSLGPAQSTPLSDSVVSRDELCPWSSVSQVLPPRLDPVIGQTVGAWKIHAKLGEGGMGAVYLARHPRLRKEVVVKVLKPELADRPRRVERFLREARLGARLSHPNLVSVQDVGTSECGLHYMVMEYIEGVNLHERIQAQGAFEPSEALRIVTEVAKALRVLHEAGVIHRDVKSENVVITPKGEVKLIDFGLAKDLSDGDQLTLPGAMIGTPVYMAPEIGRVREVDHRVDIYSLGLTWYCLVTGQQPFAGHDVHRVILGKVPLPRPRASTGDVLDPRTQNVLARMLAWHREERHPNLRAVIKDLEALTRRWTGKEPQPDRWALTRPQNRRAKPKPAEAPVEVPAPPPETDPRLILLSLLNLGLSSLAIFLAAIALFSR